MDVMAEIVIYKYLQVQLFIVRIHTLHVNRDTWLRTNYRYTNLKSYDRWSLYIDSSLLFTNSTSCLNCKEIYQVLKEVKENIKESWLLCQRFYVCWSFFFYVSPFDTHFMVCNCVSLYSHYLFFLHLKEQNHKSLYIVFKFRYSNQFKA